MMAHTDRHFRYLFRLISSSAILYTEMVMSDQLVEADESTLSKLLEYSSPADTGYTVLQLGGNNPHTIKEACTIAMKYNYHGINLNVGCPSGEPSYLLYMHIVLFYRGSSLTPMQALWLASTLWGLHL